MKSKFMWPSLAGLAATTTLILAGCGVSIPEATIQQSPPANTEMSAATSEAQTDSAPEASEQELRYQDPVSAASIALEAHPDSQVQEIFLDRVRGATVWPVEMASPHGRQEVSVDGSRRSRLGLLRTVRPGRAPSKPRDAQRARSPPHAR